MPRIRIPRDLPNILPLIIHEEEQRRRREEEWRRRAPLQPEIRPDLPYRPSQGPRRERDGRVNYEVPDGTVDYVV